MIRFSQPAALPQIISEQQLPVHVRELGRLTDSLNHNQLFVFYENSGYLSICEVDHRTLEDGRQIYRLFQRDFPLACLEWFPDTLHKFRLPPSTNLYPKMMSTHPEDVAGEMLSISRAMAAGGDTTMPGYTINNWSRGEYMEVFGTTDPSSVTFIESFLFQGGLLKFFGQLVQQLKKEGKL